MLYYRLNHFWCSLFVSRLLDSMKMPGQRPGFQISDILGLNESKGLESTPSQSALGACSLDLPPYGPPHHPYSHELLRHHQPWLSLDHHEGNGKYSYKLLPAPDRGYYRRVPAQKLRRPISRYVLWVITSLTYLIYSAVMARLIHKVNTNIQTNFRTDNLTGFNFWTFILLIVALSAVMAISENLWNILSRRNIRKAWKILPSERIPNKYSIFSQIDALI